MQTVIGKLQNYTVTADPIKTGESPTWTLSIQLDGAAYVGTTGTPVVFAVLATALVTGLQWPVELELSTANPPILPTIKRVRVEEDRSSFVGGMIPTRPDRLQVRPLTPTAFAAEAPPTWGFFFGLERNTPSTKEHRSMCMR